MARAPETDRPHNYAVENEMIRPPEQEGKPPRSATAPRQPGKKPASRRRRTDGEA